MTSFYNVEEIQKEIEEAKLKAKGVKLELLKHLLVNVALYENLSEEEKSTSSIKEKIIEIGRLFQKVEEIEKTKLISKNKLKENKLKEKILSKKFDKKSNKKSMNPREKFAKKFTKNEEKFAKKNYKNLKKFE